MGLWQCQENNWQSKGSRTEERLPVSKNLKWQKEVKVLQATWCKQSMIYDFNFHLIDF